MRIDRLKLTNYKGFAEREFTLHPYFNLFVGENAAGKTSILDALTLAMDSWFLGMKAGERSGSIKAHEVRFATHFYEDSVRFEPQYPSVVEAFGLVMGEQVSWTRDLARLEGRTSTGGAKDLTSISSEADRKVRNGLEVDLPLICSYGAERLWYETHHRDRKGDHSAKSRPSRLDGYRDCTAFEIQETLLIKWIQSEILLSQQKGSDTNALAVMKQALISCVDDAQTVQYDPHIDDLIVGMAKHGPQLFHNLSAGQRIMVIMIGDMARRAVTLNPHMGREVLQKIVGVVTIDELDLHIHPKWQRRVIHDLKGTFPNIQFVATTHSPQLIGEALPEEIRVLDNWEVSIPARSFGLDSNRILQEVMHAPPRNEATQALLSEVSRAINKEDLLRAKELVGRVADELGESDPEVTGANTLISLLESTQ
ncbi:MAG TPA: AAA family ATPase [Acidobacteriaceae bacterium]